MSSLEDVIDGHLSSIIVDMLGGPYRALSLRATSRKFRALIPAPEHTSRMREIMRINAMIGDTKQCAHWLEVMEEDGDSDDDNMDGYDIVEDASITAAQYGQLEVCRLLFEENMRHNTQYLLQGAAQRGDLALCKTILEWFATSDKEPHLAPYAFTYFFEPMMKGAIISGHMGCFNLAHEENLKRVRKLPDYMQMFGDALERGREQMCRAIWDWMRADDRELSIEDAMLRAAEHKQEAIFESMRKWGVPYNARTLAVRVAYCADLASYEMVRRAVREDMPREYARVMYDMMVAAPRRADMRAFTAIYGWVVEARGGCQLTIEELRAPLIASAEYQRADICAFLYDRVSECARCAMSE